MSSSLRSTKDIIRDLLEFAQEHEWVENYIPCGHGCCGEWKTHCPSCGAEQGKQDSETYQQHEPDCHLAALLKEAAAFLAVENEIKQRKEQ